MEVNVRSKHRLDKNGMSSIEKLSSTKQSMNPKDNHTFGCPAYFLHSSLQDHNSLPRWDKRIRVGVFLGHSKQNASNVALKYANRTR